MPAFADRVASFGTTIFTQINTLVAQHDAINLGQGRPDFDGPMSAIEAAADSMRRGLSNQYPHGYGIQSLREMIAEHQQTHYGMQLNPETDIIVSVGASEGVFSSIMAVVNPGDEVILIEPYFDIYLPAVQWAGGVPVFVPMHPPTWQINPDELRAAFTDKTRVIVINTPHNPTGHVYTDDELALIAELCIEHDAVVISDEVYEHNVYDGTQHTPIATLPGMAERTLTVSSAAKTFSFTGWKVGWIMGKAPLITGAWRIRQNISFTVNHPAQYGIAHALGLGQAYFDDYQALYTAKRDRLLTAVREAGLKAEAPAGAFYIMADFSDVFDGNDVAFTEHLIREIGVGCIPPSAFYSDDHKSIARHYVRFCYAKHDETLDRAGDCLLKLKRG